MPWGVARSLQKERQRQGLQGRPKALQPEKMVEIPLKGRRGHH